MFIDYLNLKNDVHNEYVQKYNSIAARAQTPNSRPGPPKGPDTIVYVEEKVEKVERKEPEQNKKVDRLSRKLATTLDEKTLTKIDTITPTFIDKKNKPIEERTKKQYKSSIKAIAKAYTPQQTNLNFLVTEPEKVINFLNNFNVSKRKAYYNAIGRYLPITDFPVKKQEEAHEIYNNWLKPQPQVAKKYDPDDYKGYIWETLKPKLENIIKKQKDPVRKLLLSLFTYIPTRRTKDYSYMKINEPDTGAFNILIFNDKEKKFIFNKYKVGKKIGKQIIKIENPELINELANHLSKHKGDEYLLMRKGERLSSDDIEKIMRDEIGHKYNIPTGIRTMRHLFGSDIGVDRPVDPRKLEWYATQMGTSVKELTNHYADYKKHFKSEPKTKTNKKVKKESISSIEEDIEYIPEKTMTRSGRISRKPN